MIPARYSAALKTSCRMARGQVFPGIFKTTSGNEFEKSPENAIVIHRRISCARIEVFRHFRYSAEWSGLNNEMRKGNIGHDFSRSIERRFDKNIVIYNKNIL